MPSGRHFVGGDRVDSSREGTPPFRAQDPSTLQPLEPQFADASAALVDRAAGLAAGAFEDFASRSPEQRADLLRAIASEIESLGETLIDRARAETGLPAERLLGERARTTNQLRLFADVVAEGSWVEARIDRPLPERQPLPRPDLRRMLIPLGPVAVFGSSNFPLAFSVAGGDTASALAAGCPVVVKGHPAHPGTSELVGSAVVRALESSSLPPSVFALLHGASHAVGTELATHPSIRAVAFTGSHAGGRSLFDAAAKRPEPIPVYAEMGSSNPVFLLPGALAERGGEIARGLAASVTQGAGQFCTNPGLTFLAGEATAFVEALGQALGSASPGVMVHAGIRESFDRALDEVAAIPGVECAARAKAGGGPPATEARAALLVVDGDVFARVPRLAEEIYGPVTIAVRGGTLETMLNWAEGLRGHLTATVHGTAQDLEDFAPLLRRLTHKVGRLLVNGFPTGVEVSSAMQHGGPYPATTDARATSVGTAAIYRFARPVCFQNLPEALLPPELQAPNPRRIWRWVDGSWTKAAL